MFQGLLFILTIDFTSAIQPSANSRDVLVLVGLNVDKLTSLFTG